MFKIMSLGNCKLQQWDTTTHVLEWPESKTLTSPDAGEDVEPQERSYTAGEDAKYSHFWRQFGGFL